MIGELGTKANLPVLMYPKFFPKSSFKHYVGKLNPLGRTIRFILTHTPILRKKISVYRTILLKKLLVDNNLALPGRLNNVFFTDHNRKYYVGDTEFVVFSKSLIEKYNIQLFFDDHFINGMEDHDFLFRLSLLQIPFETINYEIGLYYKALLGVSVARDLRDIIDFVYFSDKWDGDNRTVKSKFNHKF